MNTLLQPLAALPNLQAAFARVQLNAGCRGSDGVTVPVFAANLPANLRDLSNSLAKQEYHPYPLLRFPIPKNRSTVGQFAGSPVNQPTGQLVNRPTGQRFLSVPTVRDRTAQTAAFLVTKEIFEAEFEDVSHAYREGRDVRTAVYDIKEWRDKAKGKKQKANGKQ